jgi:hypothetical protein
MTYFRNLGKLFFRLTSWTGFYTDMSAITPHFSGQTSAVAGSTKPDATSKRLWAGNYAKTGERGFGRAANVC